MGFSRQVDWCGLPFPSPGVVSQPGIKPTSKADFFSFFLSFFFFFLTNEPPRKPHLIMCSSQLLSCVRLFAALWLLCPWNISGKKTRVGCLFLFQIFLTQGWNLCLFLHWQVHSLSLNHLGSPPKS